LRGRASWWRPIDWGPDEEVSVLREQAIAFVAAALLVVGIGLGGSAILALWNNGSDAAMRALCGAIGGAVSVAVVIAVLWSSSAGFAAVLLGGAIATIVAVVASLPPLVYLMSVGGIPPESFVMAAGLGAGLGVGIVAGYRHVPPEYYAERFGRVRVLFGALLVGIVLLALVVSIYYVSQQTEPGKPDSNVVVVGLLFGGTVILLSLVLDPVERGTKMVTLIARKAMRLAPIGAATAIALFVIVRKPQLPRWLDDLCVGSLAGMIVGYIFHFVHLALLSLRVRPLAAVALAPALTLAIVFASKQLGAFENLRKGWNAFFLGTIAGLLVGAAVAMLVVRRNTPRSVAGQKN
jgi:hypothetical protein